MRLYDEKQRAHFDTATVKATLEYKAPARVDDVLNVYTRIVKIGATSITAETEIYRERSGELLTWVETVSVGFDSATGTSRVVPDDVRARVNRVEETD